MDTLLEELKRSLDTALQNMSLEQLAGHPANKWSTADILEHLYLSYTGTVRDLTKIAASGKAIASPPTLPDRLRTLFVFGFDFLPSGREAPATTRPKGLSIDRVRSDFGQKMAAMDSLLSECEERLGRNTRLMDHPFLGPLTARQWRKFHLLHGLHHRKQIIRLRDTTKWATQPKP